MQYRPYIVIAGRSGTSVAIVEVKALSGADAGVQMATRYMRNLLSHGEAPRARYVMLITEDTGYVWTSPEEVLREAPPSLIFPMDCIIRHFRRHARHEEPVGDIVLEAIAEQWLWNLVDGITIDQDVMMALNESGFLSDVRGGQLSVQAAI